MDAVTQWIVQRYGDLIDQRGLSAAVGTPSFPGLARTLGYFGDLGS
jgi:hypothetical protein